jgi:predicted nucleotide-binding protein
METSAALRRLIRTGENLAPDGGNELWGHNEDLQDDYLAWRLESLVVVGELGTAADPLVRQIEADKQRGLFYESSARNVLGVLKAARHIAQRQPREGATVNATPENVSLPEQPPAEVFVVHGHNDALREQVARYLEKLDIKPIVLSEQPNRGQTLIEKLEQNSNVSLAVVLFTPDDVGKVATGDGLDRPRARQNVVLELGYFLGRLGRGKVCVLYDEIIERPSDYDGVLYIKTDNEGAWKLQLGKELKAAGLPVDMNKAV